jgi:hypothetical protein
MTRTIEKERKEKSAKYDGKKIISASTVQRP